MNITNEFKLNMCQSQEIGLDSLYCGKWKNISKSNCYVTLTSIEQCPMSNSSELFPYTTICLSFKWIGPLFFELSCTQTNRQKDTKTDRQTDMSTDKPQL